jgi:glycerol-3-phosphate acyltransferase PlsX
MIIGILGKNGVTREQISGALSHLDYASVGGAPLLGVKGVSIICHGKSSPKALKNAVLVAMKAVECNMSAHIGESMSRTVKTEDVS